jgi:hypothetical protein
MNCATPTTAMTATAPAIHIFFMSAPFQSRSALKVWRRVEVIFEIASRSFDEPITREEAKGWLAWASSRA